MNRFIYKASTSNTIRNGIKLATKSSPKSNIFSNINTFKTASAATTTTSSTSNNLPTFQNKINSNNKINLVNSNNINSVSSLLQHISFGDDDGT